MEDMNIPEVSALKEAALALHEMYISLKDAGFSNYEALVIVANMVKGNQS
jgi:hypothetical protein